MQFDKDKVIYFLGIGGIGMSALARYFLSKEYRVHGYDRTHTALTHQLELEGAAIHYSIDPGRIPADAQAAIYTPAIEQSNAEYRYFIENQIPVYKRAQVLGILSSQSHTIACAGTHGKTTTSTLTAHLLQNSSLGCNAFLGGISVNYQTNLLLNNASELMVAEADEFDRSFLQLSPVLAIITSIDADHLDIYHSKTSVVEAFNEFARCIKPGGILILKKGLESEISRPDNITCYTYSADSEADYYATNLSLIDGLYHFDLVYPGGKAEELTLGVPGLYNVENAVAASAAALLSGVSVDELREGLRTFKGVQRRFQVRVSNREFVYIDDYAHHPTEIRACLNSARELYRGRKITVVFQPHLYSRTRDFLDEFAESLSLADQVILLPIYAARENPIEGITSSKLLQLISIPKKALLNKQELPQYFDSQRPEVVITMGAGDIDTLAEIFEKYFIARSLTS